MQAKSIPDENLNYNGRRGVWSDPDKDHEIKFREDNEYDTVQVVKNLSYLGLEVAEAYCYYHWDDAAQQIYVLVQIVDVKPGSDKMVSKYFDVLQGIGFKSVKYFKKMIINIALETKNDAKKYTKTGDMYYKTINIINLTLDISMMVDYHKQIHFTDASERGLPGADRIILYIRKMLKQLNEQQHLRKIMHNQFGSNADIFAVNRLAAQKVAFELKGIKQKIINNSENENMDIYLMKIKLGLISEYNLCEYQDFTLTRMKWTDNQSSAQYSNTVRMELSEHQLENNRNIWDPEYQRLKLMIFGESLYAEEVIENAYRRKKLFEKRKALDMKKQKAKKVNKMSVWMRNKNGREVVRLIPNDQWIDDGTMRLLTEPLGTTNSNKQDQANDNYCITNNEDVKEDFNQQFDNINNDNANLLDPTKSMDAFDETVLIKENYQSQKFSIFDMINEEDQSIIVQSEIRQQFNVDETVNDENDDTHLQS